MDLKAYSVLSSGLIWGGGEGGDCFLGNVRRHFMLIFSVTRDVTSPIAVPRITPANRNNAGYMCHLHFLVAIWKKGGKQMKLTLIVYFV